jgi:catechol 2,3-dioxygenase-like lactoylglutathione lyase family enzyme
MKLTFLYHPVTDLDVAVGFYRDVLGWDEAWREGTSTAAFAIPDSSVQVMLDASDPDDDGGPGGFYEVADVDAFHVDHRDSVNWVELPQDLPPIRFASFTDPTGTLFRIFHHLK